MSSEVLKHLAVNATDFSAETFVNATQKTLLVRMIGVADMRVRATLSTFLKSLHDETTRQGSTQVQVDMRSLEFMNSSCFKSLVSWLGMVRDASPNYSVQILSSGKRHWQQRSLGAVACVAADHVQILTAD
jgi:hypothetical protein